MIRQWKTSLQWLCLSQEEWEKILAKWKSKNRIGWVQAIVRPGLVGIGLTCLFKGWNKQRSTVDKGKIVGSEVIEGHEQIMKELTSYGFEFEFHTLLWQ
jgi:hypothetical protein